MEARHRGPHVTWPEAAALRAGKWLRGHEEVGVLEESLWEPRSTLDIWSLAGVTTGGGASSGQGCGVWGQ